MKKHVHFKIIMILLLSLTGCGGGDSTTTSTDGGGTNTTPSVNAGVDQSVNEQLGATVNAIGFPAGGTFSWTQTAGPVLAGFPAAEQSVSITAPAVKTEQMITLRVEYTTTDGKIVTDDVDITVAPINHDPVAIASLKTPTTSPVAPDSTVVLDASASFDQDADGTIASYSWEQDEGSPVVSQLNGSSSVEFHFVAPIVSAITAFPFKLTVTDDEGGESEYDITVHVDPSLSVVSVDGGADMVVNEEQTVVLTATGDPVGGTFKWSQLTGDEISAFPSVGASVEFVTPTTKIATNYEFRVEYQSPTGFVDYDQVRVTVNPVNKKPVAIVRVLTPALLPAQPAELVTLDASASTDDDGSIVSYKWTQISGAVAISPESGDDSAEFKFRAPVQENPESYVYRLTVTDDEGGQGTFEIEIDVDGTSDIIVADAGVNQIVDEFSTVILNGQGSFSSISVVTCSWRLVSGPTVSFADPDSCTSSFVAPNVDINTDLIFEVKVTNVQNDTATDTTVVTVKPIPLGNIADSGQTLCYNQTGAINCADTNYPRQDADSGRDSVEQFLDKTGTGGSGFDFTKLDTNGGELPNDSTEYFCIRDNVTGLIWERKTTSTNGVPNTALRDNKNSYSWVYSEGSTGGETGTAADPLTICPSTTDCGLENYVLEVNAVVYCGANNWRVPTMLEMQSLVDYGKDNTTGVLDTSVFGDLPNEALLDHLYYWSSETSADGGGKATAWVINFANGNDNSLSKAQNAYVRLVRKP
jgi:hypothetical protein